MHSRRWICSTALSQLSERHSYHSTHAAENTLSQLQPNCSFRRQAFRVTHSCLTVAFTPQCSRRNVHNAAFTQVTPLYSRRQSIHTTAFATSRVNHSITLKRGRLREICCMFWRENGRSEKKMRCIEGNIQIAGGWVRLAQAGWSVVGWRVDGRVKKRL